MNPLNYEAHITIEPVFGDRFDAFKALCAQYGFKPAHLLMMKNRQATETRSTRDSFATGHGMHYNGLYGRTVDLVEALRVQGFQVWRYKIEATLLDARVDPDVPVLDAP